MDVIESNYTLGDMYAVTLQTWRRPAARILILIGALVVIFLAIPVLFDGVSLQESIDWFPWLFYAGLTAFLLLFVFGACPLIAYYRSKCQEELGPNRFEFLDEGLRVQGPKAQSLVYWSAVKRVTATKNRLFIFIGPALAFIVPSRAFRDQAAFEAAFAEAKARSTTAN
jgi:YcxB-like protein